MKKNFMAIFMALSLAFFISGCFDSGSLKTESNELKIVESGEFIYVYSNFNSKAAEFFIEGETSASEMEISDSVFLISQQVEDYTKISLVGLQRDIEKDKLLFSVKKTDRFNLINYTGFKKYDLKVPEKSVAPFQNGISIVDESVLKSSAVEILVHAKNISGVKAYELDIDYDSTLISTDTSKGSAFVELLGHSAGSLNIVKETSNSINISVVLDSVTNFSEEDLLKIYFLAGNTAGNASIEFTGVSKVLDTNTNPVSVNFYDGQLSITEQQPLLLGDFNGDDEVGLADFILFVNHYGLSDQAQEYSAIYDIYPAENRYDGDWADIYDYAQPDGKIDIYDFIIFAINYGKVKPGTQPTPTAPTQPSNPSPANLATQVPTQTVLSWTASIDSNGESITYDVYADKNSNPTTLVGNDISTNQITVIGLDTDSTYYWKVIARNQSDYTSQGGPWSFSTVAQSGGAKTYRALTLGVTDYGGYGDLDYTDDDSTDIETMLGHLDENYTVEKKTGYVSKTWLLNRLDEYAQMQIEPQDVFFFHYAGHGFYDNSSSQSGLSLSQGDVMVSELRQKLDALPGTKIVIIDSCESGDFTDLTPGTEEYVSTAVERMRNFNKGVVDTFMSSNAANRGQFTSEYEYYVMTGAAIDEYSYESSSIRNGYFTFFFVDGLGDVGINNPLASFDFTYGADANSNGEITFDEGYEYSYSRVLSENSDQHIQVYPNNSDFVLGTFQGGSQSNPPSTPSNPSPASGSTGISNTASLSWSSTGATSYDIYFGTSSNPPLVKSNHTSSTYQPSAMNHSTKYYWKITAKNSYGNTPGTVWNFTTSASAPSGPDFDGPVYSGNVLLASNESNNEYSSEFSGSLSLEDITEGTDTPRGLELKAYKMNPVIPLPDVDISDAVNTETVESVRYAVGDTKNFYTYNFETEQDELITATLRAQGTYAQVWVKNTTEISQQNAQLLVSEFDSVIYSSVVQNFYSPSDVNSDGRIAILCFDIKDGFDGGGYIGGYFWGGDLYSKSSVPSSNEMEIFYIDTYPGMHYPSYNPIDVSDQYSTLAHEFQHMVSFNRNRFVENSSDMDTWIDEAFSMAAEHMIYGASEMTGRISYYNSSSSIKNGHSLLYWDDTLSNYSLSYLFGQYLRLQTGQGNSIFKEILQDNYNDYRAVEKAIKKYIDSSMDFGNFMTYFRIALYLKESTGLYGFKGDSSFNSVSPQMYTGTGKYLRGGGAVMKSIPGSFTSSGNEGSDIQYVGIP